MSLEKNLHIIQQQIVHAALSSGRTPQEITLVAVSKGRSVEEIKEAYFLGVRDFGESRVREALEKMALLPEDIRWHFIGKLQRNKVAKIIGRFALIHSVDTYELALKIAHLSAAAQLQTSILLEVNTSGETTKEGLSPQEWEKYYSRLCEEKGLQIEGFMTMAPLSEDEGLIRHCFSELRFLAQRLQAAHPTTLSMGMSNDFSLAIQEGATLVRIGTALFMPR